MNHICEMTNNEMSFVKHVSGNMSQSNADLPVFADTSVLELKAFLGCLIMSGVRHDGHLNLDMMFDHKFGVLFYRSLFSLKRFEWLIRTIRFDARGERNPADRFSPFRTVWEMFIRNCRRLYVAGPVVTVDEMLAPFRGRVSFRMYIPLKPAKYGVKMFMVNDAKSQYALNAIPYLGRGSVQELSRPENINQGEFYTMELLQDLREAG